MKLNTEFVEKVRMPIYYTANAIGGDLAMVCEEMGEDLDNEEFLEACLDADRITVYGGPQAPAAQSLLRESYKVHGWDKTLRFLSKHINLV